MTGNVICRHHDLTLATSGVIRGCKRSGSIAAAASGGAVWLSQACCNPVLSDGSLCLQLSRKARDRVWPVSLHPQSQHLRHVLSLYFTLNI